MACVLPGHFARSPEDMTGGQFSLLEEIWRRGEDGYEGLAVWLVFYDLTTMCYHKKHQAPSQWWWVLNSCIVTILTFFCSILFFWLGINIKKCIAVIVNLIIKLKVWRRVMMMLERLKVFMGIWEYMGIWKYMSRRGPRIRRTGNPCAF